MHELCYAVSDRPTGGFRFGGVIVSNIDAHIDSYKPADKPAAYGGNNHGSIVEIAGQWYIFYHRHTNGTHFSRQDCAEPIYFLSDGSIPQVKMTSCGLNGGPLRGEGMYPAYIVCNLFTSANYPLSDDLNLPKITQDGCDGDEIDGHISNILDGTVIGYKYFMFHDVCCVKLSTRGYAHGVFEVKTSWNGPTLGTIPVDSTNVWHDTLGDVKIPNGTHAFYLVYHGSGTVMLRTISFS